MFVPINSRAIAVGVGIADVLEIDQLNIYWATMRASERALAALNQIPGHVLVDGRIWDGQDPVAYLNGFALRA